MYQRNLASELSAAMNRSPVVFLTGARQVGKTTLARQLAEAELGAGYWTLDDAVVRAAAKDDPDGFVAGLALPVVIDEVQRAPDLLLSIKRRVDEQRRSGRPKAGLFLLTGSSNVWTTLRISESLAGRVARLTLWPLSQSELEDSKEGFIDALLAGRPSDVAAQIDRHKIAARIARGGFPDAVRLTRTRDRAAWYDDYLGTILERDVRELANIRGLDELPSLLTQVSARSAGILNMIDLARDLGQSPTTTQRYFDLLQAVYLVQTLPAFRKNIGKRVTKSRKVYVTDAGLLASRLGFDRDRIASDRTAVGGSLFESFVAMELLRQSGWANEPVRLHHYRDVRGVEVDVVIESHSGKVAGIEAKLATSIGEADLKGLKQLRDALGADFAAGVVLHLGSKTTPLGDRLWAVPVGALWGGAE